MTIHQRMSHPSVRAAAAGRGRRERGGCGDAPRRGTGQFARTVRWLLFAAAAANLVGCFHGRRSVVSVPVQENAARQYRFALDHREEKNLALISDKRKLAKTRAVVREVFARVPQNFPDDRLFTPLAKLEIIEMEAGLDNLHIEVTNRQAHASIKEFQKLAKDYPDHEFIQAKTLFDQGLCHKRLGEFPEAQECFRQARDRFGKSKNKEILLLVKQAAFYYNRTYVN